MVINDSGNLQVGGGFEDTPPQSDNDRYDELNQSTGLQKYDGEPLPRTFLGLNDDAIPRLISITMTRAQTELGRPPTADEATALAYWAAKRLSIASYGYPLGTAFGMAQAYRTASSFRFPFFSPDPKKFNPTAFPTAKASLVTGMKAVYSWHAMRAMAYCSFGGFIGITFCASYAASVASVGTFRDTRLKDYVQAITKASQKSRGITPTPPRDSVISDRPTTPTGRQATEDNGSSKSDAYWSASSTSPSDKAFTSADVPQESQIPTPTPIRAAPRISTQPPRSTEKDTFYGSANFDDASPTGGIGVAGDVAQAESAWERIRRQDASGVRPQQESSWQSRRQAPSGATAQSTWGSGPTQASNTSGPERRRSLSKPVTDPVSEREAAQREFDEQVERERRGGNFNGGE